jgi:hypothetical protein
MSASAEEDSLPGSDCELHSVIEFQRIVLRQRHHNLISHAAKFALHPSSRTTSSHLHNPSPTHSNPANLPSILHSTPINKTQSMEHLHNTTSTPFKQTIGTGSEARKAIDRFLLWIDPAYLAAKSSPDGFPKGSILMGMQCSMICPLTVSTIRDIDGFTHFYCVVRLRADAN